jgi:hypothetical protein
MDYIFDYPIDYLIHHTHDVTRLDEFNAYLYPYGIYIAYYDDTEKYHLVGIKPLMESAYYKIYDNFRDVCTAAFYKVVCSNEWNNT